MADMLPTRINLSDEEHQLEILPLGVVLYRKSGSVNTVAEEDSEDRDSLERQYLSLPAVCELIELVEPQRDELMLRYQQYRAQWEAVAQEMCDWLLRRSSQIESWVRAQMPDDITQMNWQGYYYLRVWLYNTMPDSLTAQWYRAAVLEDNKEYQLERCFHVFLHVLTARLQYKEPDMRGL